jgi:putative DNA primase/helicase
MTEPSVSELEDQLASLKAKHGAPRRFRNAPRDWDIAVNKEGNPIACLQNVVTILSKEPEWQGVLAYDEFRSSVVFLKAPRWFEEDSPPVVRLNEPLEEEDYSRIALWLSRAYRLRPTAAMCAEAVSVVAKRQSHHPVREYLERLPAWDGVPRLDTLFCTYFGAGPQFKEGVRLDPAEEEDAWRRVVYLAKVGRWFLISAVARIFDPGCRVQVMLVLEGLQGKGKSTAVEILAGGRPWFQDTPIDLGSKDGYIALRGHWIVEIAELASLLKVSVDRVKAFISSAVDSYRPPFGRSNKDFPRQSVFIGSVNKGAYLPDETGNRRFWPVEVGRLDFAGLAQDRDQLWAEALYRYMDGEPRYPQSDEEVELFREEQDKRFQLDPWHERIVEYLEGRRHVTIPGILGDAIGLEIGDWGQNEQNRVVRVLGFLKWTKDRIRLGGGKGAGPGKLTWVYVPPPESEESPESPAEIEDQPF